ncbi:hypothetical protein EGK76_00160 [Luteimonas sp. 100069]|nr:hypothetical protein EGK76_00160 [Luteimonas sp. 100069]
MACGWSFRVAKVRRRPRTSTRFWSATASRCTDWALARFASKLSFTTPPEIATICPPPPEHTLSRCLRAEFTKLRGSLALLLCLVAPVVVAVLMALIFNRHGGGDTPWRMYLMGNAATWAFFMLPMTVTALTVLVAQMEHGPRMWNHLLALPIPRRHVFFAKASVVMLLCAGMTIVLALLAPLLGFVSDAITPDRGLTGPLGAGFSMRAEERAAPRASWLGYP